MSLTPGGLVKRSFTITQEQQASIMDEVERTGLSEAAVVRQWLDWGQQVEQKRRSLIGSVHEMAVETTAASVRPMARPPEPDRKGGGRKVGR